MNTCVSLKELGDKFYLSNFNYMKKLPPKELSSLKPNQYIKNGI